MAENLVDAETVIYPVLAGELRHCRHPVPGILRALRQFSQKEMKPPPLNGNRGFTVLLSVDRNRFCRLKNVK
jgi:hypothetical protein